MADPRLIGQAFANAANMYSQGLLDRYLRNQEAAEWQKRQDYSHGLQMEELDARFAEQERQKNVQAFRDSFKDDIKQFPEIQPFVEGYIQGDEPSKQMLSIYAGAKYKMAKNQPLSSEEIAELGPLPPGIRHGIIQGHLSSLQKHLDEEAERKRKALEADLTAARLKNVEAQTDKLRADQANLGEVEVARAGAKRLDMAQKDRDKARAALDTLSENIEAMWGQLGEKLRTGKTSMHITPENFSEVRKTLRAARGEADPAVALMDRIAKANEDKEKIEKWLRKDANEVIPGIAEEPVAEEPAGGMTEEQQLWYNALPENDKTDLFTLMRRRKDLSADECIQIFLLYKRDEANLATANKPPQGAVAFK